MSRSGLIQYQSHSYNLHKEINNKPAPMAVSANMIIEDFLKSRQVIEELTGQEVYSMAYPFGVTNQHIIESAKEVGFRPGFAGDVPAQIAGESAMQITRIPLDNISMADFKKYFNDSR